MRNVMHQYVETYLAWAFAQTDVGERIKSVWEMFLDRAIGQLQFAREMMKSTDSKDPADEIPAFTERMTNEENIEYVRKIEAEQVNLTCDLTEYKPVSELPDNHRYFEHQKTVNKGGAPSERVIDEHIQNKGGEYRQELAGEHQVDRLRPMA